MFPNSFAELFSDDENALDEDATDLSNYSYFPLVRLALIGTDIVKLAEMVADVDALLGTNVTATTTHPVMSDFTTTAAVNDPTTTTAATDFIQSTSTEVAFVNAASEMVSPGDGFDINATIAPLAELNHASSHIGVDKVQENTRKRSPPQAIVGNRRITDEMRLKVIPNLPRDVYKFSADEVAEVEAEWNATLIGVLVGARLPLQGMDTFMESHWKIPQPKIFLKDNGVWVFKFHSVEDRLWVLQNGPWIVGGNKPLILKTWKTGEAIDWASFKSVPVWAKIVDIDPMLLSSNHMPEVIGNMIGKPISIDRITHEVEKLSYACCGFPTRGQT